MQALSVHEPQEQNSTFIQWIPLTMALKMIDADGREPIYENDDLKLWHVRCTYAGERFRIVVIVSSQGASLTVPYYMRESLERVVAAEMTQMPMIYCVK